LSRGRHATHYLSQHAAVTALHAYCGQASDVPFFFQHNWPSWCCPKSTQARSRTR
jgi:hypothetical protein